MLSSSSFNPHQTLHKSPNNKLDSPQYTTKGLKSFPQADHIKTRHKRPQLPLHNPVKSKVKCLANNNAISDKECDFLCNIERRGVLATAMRSITAGYITIVIYPAVGI